MPTYWVQPKAIKVVAETPRLAAEIGARRVDTALSVVMEVSQVTPFITGYREYRVYRDHRRREYDNAARVCEGNAAPTAQSGDSAGVHRRARPELVTEPSET